MRDNRKELQERIDNVLAKKKLGWTYGIKRIDDLAGRMEAGQVITLGGFSGTGKSYFVLNMINGIRREWIDNLNTDLIPPNIVVFTTEMEQIAYEQRYICMNAGIYWNEYTKNPELHHDKIQKSLSDYYENKFVEPNFLQIFQVGTIEEIEKILNTITIKPNIVFIDHVQNLGARGKSDNKDTMPIIGNIVRDIAKRYSVALIAVSQVNTSSLTKDNNPKQSNVQPFSWGKELLQSSHTAIFISRGINDGVLDETLQVGLIKCRDGNKGFFEMKVSEGFNLISIEK